MGGAGARVRGRADVWIVSGAGAESAAVSGGGAGGADLWIGGSGRGAPGRGPGIDAGARAKAGAPAAGAPGERAVHCPTPGASYARAGRARVDGVRGNPETGAGSGISGLGAQSVFSGVRRAAGVDPAIHNGD